MKNEPKVREKGLSARRRACLSTKELREAFMSAKAHVSRQIHAGKHEQDRIDAAEWWEKYGKAM